MKSVLKKYEDLSIYRLNKNIMILMKRNLHINDPIIRKLLDSTLILNFAKILTKRIFRLSWEFI